MAVAPHRLAGLAPVHIGQIDVEEHHIGGLSLELLEAGIRRGRFAHHEFLLQSELLLQRVAQDIIVVDDENAYGHACTCHASNFAPVLI